ncbi:ROK family transcriptional regulator [Cellulomonas chengniuliangii]|uniref:ROK family transcriptional regulator n=1 Tax=Cellulomonas chengniuliangii TaxID=2968084 RepID=A0ABY5KZB1_9CELL|nr:ROK family transcriptional regulator [Cellulomonas chengniuliangii]MCC2307362.1 ROK family transcriptional regulator [Cellulomonas chengniuliangii]UUI75852.1 ROK family transcriptional regulator [Cellulomonas chengniuliangii]
MHVHSTGPARRPRPEAPTPDRAARQAGVRGQNLSLALRHVLESERPQSRADIATATGLSRATVSGLVDELIAADLLVELEPPAAVRAGRPAVPLAAARGTVAGIGMEINVDYLGVRALDLGGRVLTERVELGDFRDSDPVAVLDRLAGIAGRVVAHLSADGIRVAGTALALPGLVDRITGPLRVAPNLGWRDVDVIGILAAHPVLAGLLPRLANEAKLAARAEADARGHDGERPSFVYISGEVGIGAAIVLDGEIFPGRHGWSGEIGHSVVDAFASPPSRPAGGRAVWRQREGISTLEDLAGQDALMRGAGLDPTEPLESLLRAARAGEAEALGSLRRAGAALGVAVANVVSVVDVGLVVLGGTFGQVFPYVREAVEQQLERCVIFAPWSPIEVSEARAREYPAMTGGALVALRTVVADPATWAGAAPVAQA